MKTTIEFEDALYRRLKVEAARRGRTVRDLVAEGLRHVLDAPALLSAAEDTAAAWRPTWFASLGEYATTVDDRSMSAARRRPPVRFCPLRATASAFPIS